MSAIFILKFRIVMNKFWHMGLKTLYIFKRKKIILPIILFIKMACLV